jgi:hypothetical protein
MFRKLLGRKKKEDISPEKKKTEEKPKKETKKEEVLQKETKPFQQPEILTAEGWRRKKFKK